MPARTNVLSLMLARLTTLLITASVFAQANYSQSFQGVGDGTSAAGGPPVLVSQGWIFRNQSRPSGTGTSPYWTEFPAWGQTGSALGHGGFAVWQNSSSKISAWIILPAIANQQANDPLSVWTSGPSDAFGGNTASLEFRYSPTGAAGTGSGENDVGSFTQLLGTVSGAHAWTQRTFALPGSGRIAMRLVIGPGSSSQIFGGSMLIDSLQIGVPPPPPYPLPAAGQTVHWTSAHSPVQISLNGSGQHPRIIANGRVIVDAGVEVRISSGARLMVSGVLELAGTVKAPVKLRGPGWITIEPAGFVSAAHADVRSFTDVLYGGKATFTDSAFTDPTNPTSFSYDSAGDIGHRFFNGDLSYPRQVVSLTRCSFGQGCSVSLLRGWIAVRDCTFMRGQQVGTSKSAIGGEAMFIVGNSILDNVSVTEGYIDLTQDHQQHRYLGSVTVTGNIVGPALRLEGGGNYLIDATATLTGNKWPVTIGSNSAGILPGSVLPVAGNQFNEVLETDDSAPLDEDVVRADAGVPYVLWNNSTLRGKVTVLPGVVFKAMPDVNFFFDTDSNGVSMPVFLGEPERPIRFEPYSAGAQWSGVVMGGTQSFGTRWQWCIFEGSRYGVGVSEAPLALDDCIFRNNHRALYSESHLATRGCLFESNVYSITGERFAPVHDVAGFLDANHPANPNTFLDNNGVPGGEYFSTFLPNGGLLARARHNSLENTDSDVRNNWWGTPTGPFHATRNPNGLGDAVFFGIDNGGYLAPFLSSAPITNTSPVVRFVTHGRTVVPGETVVLQWTARDDGNIVTQRLYYSADSIIDSHMQLLAEVSASTRSFEWKVPVIGTPANGTDQFLRVVAVDNLGREGIADVPLKITNPTPFTGTATPASVAATIRPGESVAACAAVVGEIGSMYVALELENDESGMSLGSAFVSGSSACTVLPMQTPDVSTDRARLRFDATGSLNQVRSFYGPYFAIRPDALLGDAPPAVALTSSHTATVAGGSIVHIAWTASDDDALRAFDIRASYDGGKRWFIVARDLAADARTYAWHLADSPFGIADVRIRVVAKDLRFQNTSTESGSFSIASGFAGATGDINGDGSVDATDLAMLLASWGTSGAAADLDQSGTVDASDLSILLAAWGG